MGLILMFMGVILGMLGALTLAVAITFLVGSCFGMKPDFFLLGNRCWIRMGNEWKRMTSGGASSLNIAVNMATPNGEWRGGQIVTLFVSLILGPIILGVIIVLSFRRDSSLQALDDPVFSATVGAAIPFLFVSLFYAATFFKIIRRHNFAEAFSDVARISHVMRLPLRHRDWDRDLIERVLAGATKDRNDLFRDMVAYFHFWDSGDRDRGLEILRNGASRATGSHIVLGNVQEYWFELAYAVAVHNRNLEEARMAFKRGAAIKGDFADSSRFRAEAAILLLQGDQTGAMSAIVKSKAALAKLYAPDDPRMQSNPEWLGELENQCMQPGEAGYFRS